MRVFLLFLAIAAILLLSGSAFAAVERFPSTIDFFEEPQKITFSVSNPASTTQRVSIEFFAPVETTIEKPANIEAKKTANVSLILSPKKELTGQNYESTLVVRVGSDETRKRVRLFFHTAAEKPQTIVPADSNAIKDQNAKKDSNANGLNFTALVSFLSRPKVELALDIILIIVAAILLVAFIARIVNRVKG